MKRKKSPHLKQGGTANAHRLAQQIVEGLIEDPDALELVMRMVRLLAERSRSEPR